MPELPSPLPFTLCFIQHNDHLLMLRRNFEPWAGLLNGVGGKLEPGESPLACVLREAAEETGVHLAAPRFSGIVTWSGFPRGGVRSGMYVYLGQLPGGLDPVSIATECEEGVLSWVPTRAVLEGCTDAVTNIPGFLGPMLAGMPPAEHSLAYDGRRLLSHRVLPLPEPLGSLA
jgi:8-oxo-dGTP diphosphatase